MKDLQSVLKLLVVAIVAAVALGVVLTGRAAVQEYYDYQTFVAPRTLHQMTLEMEAAGEPDRSNTLLFGAGLLALAGLTFGGFLFAMRGGTDLLRERRLSRKRKSRRPATTSLPLAPPAPLLGDGRDDNEYYTNRNAR